MRPRELCVYAFRRPLLVLLLTITSSSAVDPLLPVAYRCCSVRPVPAQGDDAVRDRGAQGTKTDRPLCVLNLCRAALAPFVASHPGPLPPSRLTDDDGTGEEMTVPLGTTAFVSGATMFDRLSPAEKSLVVRMKVRYVSCLPLLNRSVRKPVAY